jgi:hypothetical protein
MIIFLEELQKVVNYFDINRQIHQQNILANPLVTHDISPMNLLLDNPSVIFTIRYANRQWSMPIFITDDNNFSV